MKQISVKVEEEKLLQFRLACLRMGFTMTEVFRFAMDETIRQEREKREKAEEDTP